MRDGPSAIRRPASSSGSIPTAVSRSGSTDLEAGKRFCNASPKRPAPVHRSLNPSASACREVRDRLAFRGTRHRLPERRDGSFGLAHQHIRAVRELPVVVDQPAGCPTCVFCSAAYFVWKHRTGVEVLADARGQIYPTARAELRAVAEEVHAQLLCPKQYLKRSMRLFVAQVAGSINRRRGLSGCR
jgi:hypothetical protein